MAFTLNQQGDELEVTLASFEGGTITTHMRAQIASERTITADHRFDLLYIPGGIGAGAASQDERALELVRAHHREGRGSPRTAPAPVSCTAPASSTALR
ncbi:DJ-1/PfpI family protein [Streptomyces sp. NPDC001890]|uniref:DJ-1/PfpI family protein n=1 Tax=Streptomyces sp. NPDC001890 TaxID=3364620 RepID=UPI003685AFC3